MKNVLLFLVAFALTAPAGFAAVEVGKQAPEFTLKGHDGKTYNLADYKGKHVVLEWYNDDCPYVDKHYSTKNMQKLQEKYTKDGVAWFSIISSAPGKQGHVDHTGASKLLASRKAKPTAILLDPNGKVGKAFGAKVTPHMYVINKEQKVVYMGAIDDKPTARHASVKTAKNYVVDALKASMAGKKVTMAATKPYGCGVKY